MNPVLQCDVDHTLSGDRVGREESVQFVLFWA